MAAGLLSLSQRAFDKCVERGLLPRHSDNGHEYYHQEELLTFKQTDEYRTIRSGTIDQRNRLNNLTGKEWIAETRSYMFQKGLGASHPHAQIERQHPAPFSYQDIEKLISFFTQEGMCVLDPFGGVGSTAKAADLLGRSCISIELSPKYHRLSLERMESEIGSGASARHRFINGDSCQELPRLPSNSVDFVVTSPPYWGILNKQDQKVIEQRVKKQLDTKYSESAEDLGNISDYNEFLTRLCDGILLPSARILRSSRYMAIIVSDFRDKGEFVSFHTDLIQRLNKAKIAGGGLLSLQGTKILIQNHKSLHPYGYPFAYVENIHHQYILIFKKK